MFLDDLELRITPTLVEPSPYLIPCHSNHVLLCTLVRLVASGVNAGYKTRTASSSIFS